MRGFIIGVLLSLLAFFMFYAYHIDHYVVPLLPNTIMEKLNDPKYNSTVFLISVDKTMKERWKRYGINGHVMVVFNNDEDAVNFCMHLSRSSIINNLTERK